MCVQIPTLKLTLEIKDPSAVFLGLHDPVNK